MSDFEFDWGITYWVVRHVDGSLFTSPRGVKAWLNQNTALAFLEMAGDEFRLEKRRLDPGGDRAR